MLHMHIFLCFGFCVGIKGHENASEIVLNLGILTTPPIAVFLINNVGDFYPEIQSWEISWIIWGVCVFLIGISECVWIRHSSSERQTAIHEFGKVLLSPFGIIAKDIGGMYSYICPLVAVAPSIVGGYIANFFLEIKYYLDCDPSYNDISNICENEGTPNEVCCITFTSHQEWIEFLPQLASSSLAAWGAVKVLGTFLVATDDAVVVVEEAKESEAGMSGTGRATNIEAVVPPDYNDVDMSLDVVPSDKIDVVPSDNVTVEQTKTE